MSVEKPNRLELWLQDRRWAANMRRARRWRRGLAFSQRRRFDESLRHPLGNNLIDYPDAIWHATADDVFRAMSHSINKKES